MAKLQEETPRPPAGGKALTNSRARRAAKRASLPQNLERALKTKGEPQGSKATVKPSRASVAPGRGVKGGAIPSKQTEKKGTRAAMIAPTKVSSFLKKVCLLSDEHTEIMTESARLWWSPCVSRAEKCKIYDVIAIVCPSHTTAAWVIETSKPQKEAEIPPKKGKVQPKQAKAQKTTDSELAHWQRYFRTRMVFKVRDGKYFWAHQSLPGDKAGAAFAEKLRVPLPRAPFKKSAPQKAAESAPKKAQAQPQEEVKAPKIDKKSPKAPESTPKKVQVQPQMEVKAQKPEQKVAAPKAYDDRRPKQSYKKTSAPSRTPGTDKNGKEIRLCIDCEDEFRIVATSLRMTCGDCAQTAEDKKVFRRVKGTKKDSPKQGQAPPPPPQRKFQTQGDCWKAVMLHGKKGDTVFFQYNLDVLHPENHCSLSAVNFPWKISGVGGWRRKAVPFEEWEQSWSDTARFNVTSTMGFADRTQNKSLSRIGVMVCAAKNLMKEVSHVNAVLKEKDMRVRMETEVLRKTSVEGKGEKESKLDPGAYRQYTQTQLTHMVELVAGRRCRIGDHVEAVVRQLRHAMEWSQALGIANLKMEGFSLQEVHQFLLRTQLPHMMSGDSSYARAVTMPALVKDQVEHVMRSKKLSLIEAQKEVRERMVPSQEYFTDVQAARVWNLRWKQVDFRHLLANVRSTNGYSPLRITDFIHAPVHWQRIPSRLGKMGYAGGANEDEKIYAGTINYSPSSKVSFAEKHKLSPLVSWLFAGVMVPSEEAEARTARLGCEYIADTARHLGISQRRVYALTTDVGSHFLNEYVDRNGELFYDLRQGGDFTEREKTVEKNPGPSSRPGNNAGSSTNDQKRPPPIHPKPPPPRSKEERHHNLCTEKCSTQGCDGTCSYDRRTVKSGAAPLDPEDDKGKKMAKKATKERIKVRDNTHRAECACLECRQTFKQFPRWAAPPIVAPDQGTAALIAPNYYEVLREEDEESEVEVILEEEPITVPVTPDGPKEPTPLPQAVLEEIQSLEEIKKMLLARNCQLVDEVEELKSENAAILASTSDSSGFVDWKAVAEDQKEEMARKAATNHSFIVGMQEERAEMAKTNAKLQGELETLKSLISNTTPEILTSTTPEVIEKAAYTMRALIAAQTEARATLAEVEEEKKALMSRESLIQLREKEMAALQSAAASDVLGRKEELRLVELAKEENERRLREEFALQLDEARTLRQEVLEDARRKWQVDNMEAHEARMLEVKLEAETRMQKWQVEFQEKMAERREAFSNEMENKRIVAQQERALIAAKTSGVAIQAHRVRFTGGIANAPDGSEVTISYCVNFDESSAKKLDSTVRAAFSTATSGTWSAWAKGGVEAFGNGAGTSASWDSKVSADLSNANTAGIEQAARKIATGGHSVTAKMTVRSHRGVKFATWGGLATTSLTWDQARTLQAANAQFFSFGEELYFIEQVHWGAITSRTQQIVGLGGDIAFHPQPILVDEMGLKALAREVDVLSVGRLQAAAEDMMSEEVVKRQLEETARKLERELVQNKENMRSALIAAEENTKRIQGEMSSTIQEKVKAIQNKESWIVKAKSMLASNPDHLKWLVTGGPDGAYMDRVRAFDPEIALAISTAQQAIHTQRMALQQKVDNGNFRIADVEKQIKQTKESLAGCEKRLITATNERKDLVSKEQVKKAILDTPTRGWSFDDNGKQHVYGTVAARLGL